MERATSNCEQMGSYGFILGMTSLASCVWAAVRLGCQCHNGNSLILINNFARFFMGLLLLPKMMKEYKINISDVPFKSLAKETALYLLMYNIVPLGIAVFNKLEEIICDERNDLDNRTAFSRVCSEIRTNPQRATRRFCSAITNFFNNRNEDIQVQIQQHQY